MRNFFTLLCASLLTVAASAQTTTGALSPRAHSVYSPATYPIGITATYDNLIVESDSVSAKATATLTFGSESVTVERDSITAYSAYFNIASAVSELGITDGDTFTLAISNIENGDTISREVETLSTTYKYLTTIPSATISPAEGTVTSKSFDVTFTYDSAMVAEYIGTRSGAGSSIVANVFDGSTTASSTISFSVVDSLWASSATDLTITLDGLKDAAGYYYPNESVTYQYGEETVNYLGVDPDPEWTSYEDIVGGYVAFMFDKDVQLPEDGTTIVTVNFLDDSYSLLASKTVDNSLVSSGYSFWMNCYTVEFEAPEIPTEAENYSFAVIELQGLTYNGTLLSEQPSATYEANISSSAKKHGMKIGTTNVNSTNSAINSTFGVYNLNGVLLSKGISKSELYKMPKGIYIVGGKKIIFK